MKRIFAAIALVPLALGVVVAVSVPKARAQNAQTTSAIAPQAAVSESASVATYLKAGEQLVRFNNGCSMILYEGESIATMQQASWFGRCAAGLVDGPGLILYGGQRADGKYYPSTMRLGRPSVSTVASQGSTRIVRRPRVPGSEESESILTHRAFVEDPPASGPKITDRNGVPASFVMTTVDRRNSARSEVDSLWVEKRICPESTTQSIDASLAQAERWAILEPAQRAKVVSVCKAALDRLKSEGRASNPSASGALFGGLIGGTGFKAVDYGYYFIVFLRHDARPLTTGGAYANYDPNTWPPPQYSNVSLCPQVTTLAGCEPVWQALLTPFTDKQDAYQAATAKAQAEGEADRRLRFGPLIAAQKASLRAATMRMGATYRPRAAAPSRAPAKPKTAVRKRK